MKGFNRRLRRFSQIIDQSLVLRICSKAPSFDALMENCRIIQDRANGVKASMLKAILPFTLAAGLMLSLSGCVGAGVVKGETYKWDIADDSRIALCPTKRDREVIACAFQEKCKICTDTINEVTPEKVLEWWGVPKSDTIVNGKRVLVYNRRFAWRGVVIFVIIPIPLLVPLGHAEATFVFSGEQLVHTEYVENRLTAAVCGLHSEGPDGFGCIADWH